MKTFSDKVSYGLLSAALQKGFEMEYLAELTKQDGKATKEIENEAKDVWDSEHQAHLEKKGLSGGQRRCLTLADYKAVSKNIKKKKDTVTDVKKDKKRRRERDVDSGPWTEGLCQ